MPPYRIRGPARSPECDAVMESLGRPDVPSSIDPPRGRPQLLQLGGRLLVDLGQQVAIPVVASKRLD